MAVQKKKSTARKKGKKKAQKTDKSGTKARYNPWEKAAKKKSVKKRRKTNRDIEMVYSRKQMAEKLRRFADSLLTGKPFRIQVAGERVFIPISATYSIEHERGSGEEELEFQLKWTF